MTSDNKYPYGYQLSFLERTKLRLKKINYRLSLGISISFFVCVGIAVLIQEFLQEPQLSYWNKIWNSLAFLLLGFQGSIWVITGEWKKLASLTYRGKWVTIAGMIMWVFCWFVAVYIMMK